MFNSDKCPEWDEEVWFYNLPFYEDLVIVMGEYNPNIDYVGAEGDWKSKLIPKTIWGININRAAFIHDYWYKKGGTAHDRFVADTMFLADMLKIIEMSGVWRIRRFLARHRAVTYFHAVREAGEKAFALRK